MNCCNIFRAFAHRVTNEQLIRMLPPGPVTGEKFQWIKNSFNHASTYIFRLYVSILSLESFFSQEEIENKLTQRISILSPDDPQHTLIKEAFEKIKGRPMPSKPGPVNPQPPSSPSLPPNEDPTQGDFWFYQFQWNPCSNTSSLGDLLGWIVRLRNLSFLDAFKSNHHISHLAQADLELAYWHGIEVAVEIMDIPALEKLLSDCKRPTPVFLLNKTHTHILRTKNERAEQIFTLLLNHHREKGGKSEFPPFEKSETSGKALCLNDLENILHEIHHCTSGAIFDWQQVHFFDELNEDQSAKVFTVLRSCDEEIALQLLKKTPLLIQHLAENPLSIALNHQWFRCVQYLIQTHPELVDKRRLNHLSEFQCLSEGTLTLWPMLKKHKAAFMFPVEKLEENVGSFNVDKCYQCLLQLKKLIFQPLDGAFYQAESSHREYQNMYDRMRTFKAYQCASLRETLVDREGKPNHLAVSLYQKFDGPFSSEFKEGNAMEPLAVKCIDQKKLDAYFLILLVQGTPSDNDLIRLLESKDDDFLNAGIDLLLSLGFDFKSFVNQHTALFSQHLRRWAHHIPTQKLIQFMDQRNAQGQNTWSLLTGKKTVEEVYADLCDAESFEYAGFYNLNSKALLELYLASDGRDHVLKACAQEWVLPRMHEKMHTSIKQDDAYAALLTQLEHRKLRHTLHSIVNGIPNLYQVVEAIVLHGYHDDQTAEQVIRQINASGVKWNDAVKPYRKGNLLHRCIKMDRPGMIAPLVEGGVSLGALDKDGNTPLQSAVKLQRPALVKAVLESSQKVSLAPHQLGFADALTLANHLMPLNAEEAVAAEEIRQLLHRCPV